MNLKLLLVGLILWMFIAEEQLSSCAARLIDSPSHDSCDKCSLLDANKEDRESSTMEVINTRSMQTLGKRVASFKDHSNTHRPQKSPRRTLSRKHHVFEGKKGRWLAVDEVDYLGPRTHPPTKPPRK